MGYNYTQGRNAVGDVDRVDYFGGATFATNENSGHREGVTIGHYININDKNPIQGNFRDHVLSDQLYMHEYGHTIQSQIYGPLYLFPVGLFSLISAGTSVKDESVQNPNSITRTNTTIHDSFITEKWANTFAKSYFFNYYGYEWDEYWNNHYYPTR